MSAAQAPGAARCAAPMLWLVVAYLGALALLFVTAFWRIDDFTGQVTREFTLDNFENLFTTPAYRGLVLRTIGIAASVTVLCAVLALPFSFFVARVVPRGTVPSWWHSWSRCGPRTWSRSTPGGRCWSRAAWWPSVPVRRSSPGFGTFAIIVTLTYLWLPYMILPVYAGLERLPDSLLDASADLGARPDDALHRAAVDQARARRGSIFTFSLSLGDYITAKIVGGKVTMLGNVSRTTSPTCPSRRRSPPSPC